MNPKVNFYFIKEKNWQEELKQLRRIILNCHLSEELKWGVPCYSFNKNNILLIHVFKEYCAILFFKGVLLKDTKDLLIQQTKNVQSARQIRFTKVKEIIKMKMILKEYILEAIDIEKEGLKVKLKKTVEYKVSEEFQNELNRMPSLKTAFNALTPGRQRAYLLYFSAPKQLKTREARVKKCIALICDGVGLND